MYDFILFNILIIIAIEGWIIIVRNIHEESQEEDIHDLFAEFGEIMNMHLNLDRKTGFVKGYCLIEYANFEEAQKAIKEMNGYSFRERKLSVSWAFVEPPSSSKSESKRLISDDKKLSTDTRRKREYTTQSYQEEKKRRERY